MTVKKYGLSGISSNVELGIDGLRIIADPSYVSLKNNDEVALTRLKVADGVDADDVVTKAQHDAKQNTLTIAAGSEPYLDITADELSVKQLLVTDVTVDNIYATIELFVAANYTGSEYQSGDIIILMAATDSQKRVYIHNGGSAATVADFTRMQVDLSETVIRAMFSAGSGLTYNAATGQFSLDVVTAADVSVDDTGFSTIVGATAQACLLTVDTVITSILQGMGDFQDLFGVTIGQNNLGTFTHGIFSNNSNVKTVLQEAETELHNMTLSASTLICVDGSATKDDTVVNLTPTIPSGRTIKRIYLNVTQVFDGTPTLQIGTLADSDWIVGTADFDLTQAGVQEKTVYLHTVADTDLIATIFAVGSTTGAIEFSVEAC